MFYYIYKITILDGSGRYYIGQRKSKIDPELDVNYKGSGRRIKALYRRHGGYKVVREGEYYHKEILETIPDGKDAAHRLNEAEFRWIGDLYSTDPKCLNLKAGGNQPGYSSKARKKMSDVAKQHYKDHPDIRVKLSEKQKARWNDPEFVEKYYKTRRTPEFKQRQSESRKGWKPSAETKKRMSESHKGTKLSAEHKEKIRKANKGRPKYKYLLPSGEVKELRVSDASRLRNKGIALIQIEENKGVLRENLTEE